MKIASVFFIHLRFFFFEFEASKCFSFAALTSHRKAAAKFSQRETFSIEARTFFFFGCVLLSAINCLFSEGEI